MGAMLQSCQSCSCWLQLASVLNKHNVCSPPLASLPRLQKLLSVPTSFKKFMSIPPLRVIPLAVRSKRLRIRVVQLEGAYKDHPVQWPDCFRASQQRQCIDEGIVQMPSEHDGFGASRTSPGRLCQCLTPSR